MQLMSLPSSLLGLVAAVATIDNQADSISPSNPDQLLSSRQIVEANPTVRCCTNCQGRYGTTAFQDTFHNLCDWAGGRLKFESPKTYYTGNYYCPSPLDDSVCMHLVLQYLCDQEEEVTYSGCMGYYDFVINPLGTCGGPPFPGGQVESADGCWVFQATADLLSDFTSHDLELEELQCDASGRWCTLPGSNDTVNTYAGPEHEFGDAVLL